MSSGRAALWTSTAALVLVCVVPVTSFAQAWLPPKGQGSVSIGFQSFYVPWHLVADGSEQEEADLRIKNVTADTTYSLSDKVALDFGIPYVASRYGGVLPEGAHDNGKYYATFQDFRVNVRYAMWNRGFALTPAFDVVLPSHQYETQGHTAPGRHLYELGLGLHAGRSLSPALPNTYVQLSYAYALAQHVVHERLDLSLNRSNAEFEMGHLLTSALTVRGFGSWQRTHGGLEWTDEPFDPVHDAIHDRAARASYWRLGGGVAYSVNKTLDLYASMLTTVSGKNTHKVGGFVFGTTWTFRQGGGLVGVTSSRLQQAVVGAARRL